MQLISRQQTTHHIGKAQVVLDSIAVRAVGLAWARPTAVRVRGAAGEQRLPIHDVTRRRQMLLYAFAALCVIVGILAPGRRDPGRAPSSGPAKE